MLAVSNMKTSSLKRLLTLLAPHKSSFILGLVYLSLGSGINLLFPQIIRALLSPRYSNFLFERPLSVGLVLILLFAIQAVCFYFRSYIFGAIGHKVVAYLRENLYQAYLRREMAFFDAAQIGDLISRLNADTALIQDAISVKLSVFLRYGLQVILGIIAMCLISTRLTLAIVISLPIIVGLSLLFVGKLKFYSKSQQSALGQASHIADETLAAVKIVKAFNRDQFEVDRFTRASQQVLYFGIKRSAIAAIFSSFVNLLMNACLVLVLCYGLNLVFQQNISSGDLTAFMLYGAIVGVSFAFVAGNYAEFVQAVGAGERVFEIIDESPQHARPVSSIKLSAAPQGEFQFSEVTFAYPTRPGVPVLDKISFNLPARKTSALVGPSGSGKSTIVNLLLKLYPVNEGTISIDGIDYAKLERSDLLQHFAIVPQEPQLFALSIAENLRYGLANATQEQIERACEQANILQFVRSLPQGFETNIGQSGLSLSAGQRQRLAIARAIIKDPRVLILDEATSALDSESEAAIQHALNNIMKDRTCVVIAHRLSTVKNAHQILVLEHGHVLQSGDHESLMRTGGLYRQWVELQALAGSGNTSTDLKNKPGWAYA